MNLDDFSYEENGRRYIDPNVSLNEQNAFIQNLRDAQGERNAQIAQQTHNLGTDVPSNYGGLNGSESYFNSRYQTPQTNAVVANLKATAQAQALSEALNNELAKAKKRYSDAYRASQGGGGSGTGGGDDGTTEGEVDINSTESTDKGSIWTDGSIGENDAYYGLYHLKRNNGESQADWKKRAEQWIWQQSVSHRVQQGGSIDDILEELKNRQKVNASYVPNKSYSFSDMGPSQSYSFSDMGPSRSYSFNNMAN